MDNTSKSLLLSGFILFILLISIFFFPTPLKMHGEDPNKASAKNQSKINSILKSPYFSFKIDKSKVLRSELPNVLNKGSIANSTSVALIKPTFTDAAYHNKFYKFYAKYADTNKANITKDLKLLNSKLTNHQDGSVSNVFALLDLSENIKLIDSKIITDSLTDLDVDKGNIFDKNNNNAYDVIMLGHQEYVTQNEYNNLKRFVSNGGTMIILDGNVFYAEVKYFDKNNTISLVKGHGWAFNGKSAWKSVNERWENETKEWVGSNYLCYKCIGKYKENPFDYIPHEEQRITNPKDIILLNYNPIEFRNNDEKDAVVATYELHYGNGTVIALGIYSDDIIHNGKFNRFFDNLFVKYGMGKHKKHTNVDI